MATVNFIKNSKQSGGAMGGTIRYVERDDKTMKGRFVSGQNCTPRLAEQEFLATREVNHKDGGRWFYHYTQSFSPKEDVTPEQAHKIAKEFAAHAWPENEVVIATHVDAEHIHSHFVVNAVCFETGKTLRQHPDTLQKLRAISDELCMAHGLSVLSPEKRSQRSNGMSAREYRAAVKGESWKFQLMAAVDDCMQAARSREDFIERMEHAGYEVRWEDSRANITYTVPGGVKCRDKRLHDDKYLKERMENEFRIRREIIESAVDRAKQKAALRAADADHGGVSGRGEMPRTDGADTRGAASDQRSAVRTPDAEGAGSDAGFAGAGARSDATSGEETGWEKEREAFLNQLAEGQAMAVGSSPEAVMGMADRDSLGWRGMAGAAPAESHHGVAHAGSVISGLARLGHDAEETLDEPSAYDATMRPEHIDSKRRRELQEKRIALGHKPDDHEDEQQWQQQQM